jgi:hypothetical protein
VVDVEPFTIFGGEDVPIFMLALVDKGQKSDLSQA